MAHTQSLTELKARFAVPGMLDIQSGPGGLTRLLLTTPGAEACIYLHGAHVAHYQPRGQAPVLFMSAKSLFQADKPIRGGVPICFPWFGPHGGDPQAPMHGFARLVDWTLESARLDSADGTAVVVLSLGPSDASRLLWPHEFAARYTVTIGPRLEMALQVRNLSAAALGFEEALHTYLSVGDVRQVSIEGLAQTAYLDKTDAGRRKQQGIEPITVTGETDRVYLSTRSACLVRDPLLKRTLRIDKSGSDSTVVWNPWIGKARAMPDFGDDEWPSMLCIETGNVAESGVTLAPGASHTVQAVVSVGPL